MQFEHLRREFEIRRMAFTELTLHVKLSIFPQFFSDRVWLAEQKEKLKERRIFKKKRSRIITTKQQYAALLELLQQKPDMAHGFTKCSKEEALEFWENVAEELNSLDPPNKEVTSWKKVWLDWKAYIKKKLAENKREQAATGGGRHRQHHFSELEEAVIRLTSLETSTHGIQNTVSAGLPVADDVADENEADVSMSSVSRSPALRRGNLSARKPTNTNAAEILKEHIILQKDFQEMTLEHFSKQEAKLEDLCSGMRRLYKAIENQTDLKNATFEETRRHHKAIEELIHAKNSIKRQMLLVEETTLKAISKK